MTRIRLVAIACVAVLVTSCTTRPRPESVPVQENPDSSIVRDGIVYTPVSTGPRGCMRYSVRIPGGLAPAALVYQSVDGTFSYSRPDPCVGETETR